MRISIGGKEILHFTWSERREAFTTDKSPSDFIKSLGMGVETKSGANVDEESALAYSAVFSCVRILSETIGSLNINVYKSVENGRELYNGHPVEKLLRMNPNAWMTPFTFKQVMMTFATLWGNAYAKIKHDGGMRPVSLDIIHPDVVKPVIQDGKLFYVVQAPGKKKETIPDYKMVHIPGLSIDGITGLEIVDLAKEAIGLGLASEKFGAEFFGAGANSDVILSYPGKLSQQGKDNLGSSFDKKYRGSKDKTIVLEEGVKMERTTFSPEQSQFLMTRKFQVADVARFFRVPLHMVNELDKSSFNNIEHQSLEFVKYTILPWVVRWEEELNRKLFYESEKGSVFIDFNLDDLMRGDAAARSTIMTSKMNAGALTPNEIRMADGMNKVPGGDMRYVNAALVALDENGLPINSSDGEGNKGI